MENWIRVIDVFSKAVGHAFAWCVLVLTASTCYEVFMRYVLNAPTVWAFDMSYIMYGALFIMSGAYALSRGSHVRGDFIYRLLGAAHAGQGRPGAVLHLLLSRRHGDDVHRRPLRVRVGPDYHEVSVNSPVGVPIWPAQAADPRSRASRCCSSRASPQVMRCILCIRTGKWPRRSDDVEELEKVLIEQARKRRRKRK